MQNERQRILAMLENGTITTDEALTLLETLGQSKQTTKSVEVEQVAEEVTLSKTKPAEQTKQQQSAGQDFEFEKKKTMSPLWTSFWTICVRISLT